MAAMISRLLSFFSMNSLTNGFDLAVRVHSVDAQMTSKSVRTSVELLATLLCSCHISTSSVSHEGTHARPNEIIC